ncbi:FMN-binding negative transcriptional regulator [Kineococcus glutinatus]|uniref:FMN-binding negative transcriptional regulator n=1 Tax=Kineococcus glutinatus TaxID=1070872 RepID=A0ABP9HX11_9ACTN
MFVPRPDAPRDDAECWQHLAAAGFGTLVAAGGPDREVPVVVPTQYTVHDVPGSPPRVVLHLARPNPVWAAVAERPVAVLSVARDWAYVPGAWNAGSGTDPDLGVPTTYYAAVQVVADVEVVEEPGALLDLLRVQLAALDPQLADPQAHRNVLRGIRGAVLHPREVRGKFKVGGNRDAAHRAGVAQRLAGRDGPGDAAVLAHLHRREPARR